MSDTVKEDIRADDSVLHEANFSSVEGSGNEIFGNYLKINGDINIVSGLENHVNGDGNHVNGTANYINGNDEVITGKHNHVKGNNIIVDNGFANHVYGDNLFISGYDNQINTKRGGAVSITGRDNWLDIVGSNEIDLTGSTDTKLSLAIRNGHSDIVGFVTGDTLSFGPTSTFSLSTCSEGTKIAVDFGAKHHELFFKDTSLDIVEESIHGGTKLM